MHRSIVSRVAGCLLALVALAGAARATTRTWTNAAGGAWSNAANWSPSGAPASGDAVMLPAFGGAYTVTLDATPSLSGLSVGAGATLAMAAGDSLTFTGRHLANDGSIVVGPGVENSIFFTDSVFVDGTGTIRMSGAGRLACNLPRPQTHLMLLNGAGHTLAGTGDLWLPIVNHGAIVQTGGLLTLWEKLYNYGTVSVSGGGTVNVNCPFVMSHGGTIVGRNGTFSCLMPYPGGANQGPIDNLDGGTFVADGGDLTILAGVIAGGTVARTGGGGAVHFIDVGNPNNVVIGPGAELTLDGTSIYTVDAGAFENHGTFRLRGTLLLNSNAANDTILLAGGGRLELEGGTLATTHGGVVRNAPGDTLSGCGTIACAFANEGVFDVHCAAGEFAISGGSFENRATIVVDNSYLHVAGATTRLVNRGTLSGGTGGIIVDGGATIDNAGGTLLSGAAGTVLGGDAGAATITGGTLGAVNNGWFMSNGGVTLRDLTIGEGARFFTTGGATTRARGSGVVVAGLNQVLGGGAFVADAGTAYLQSAGTLRLEGGTITVPAGVTLQGALTGTGTLNGALRNSGSVRPDVGAAGLHVAGDYVQSSAGRLEIPLAGPGADQYGRLAIAGTASLDGAATFVPVGGYQPALGATYAAMGAGARSGQFAALAPQGGVPMCAVYGPAGVTFVVATALGVDGAPAPLALAFRAQGGGLALALPHAAQVDVRAFDVAGREVARLASGALTAGTHAFALPRALPSGHYFARASIVSGGVTVQRRAEVLVIH